MIKNIHEIEISSPVGVHLIYLHLPLLSHENGCHPSPMTVCMGNDRILLHEPRLFHYFYAEGRILDTHNHAACGINHKIVTLSLLTLLSEHTHTNTLSNNRDDEKVMIDIVIYIILIATITTTNNISVDDNTNHCHYCYRYY